MRTLFSPQRRNPTEYIIRASSLQRRRLKKKMKSSRQHPTRRECLPRLGYLRLAYVLLPHRDVPSSIPIVDSSNEMPPVPLRSLQRNIGYGLANQNQDYKRQSTKKLLWDFKTLKQVPVHRTAWSATYLPIESVQQSDRSNCPCYQSIFLLLMATILMNLMF